MILESRSESAPNKRKCFTKGAELSLTFAFIFCLQLCSYSLAAQTYFQQDVAYRIQVTLNDETHELNADEEIEYLNNSNQTLQEIYFHLWPNAYKNDHTALAKQLLENGETSFYYSKPESRGYINGLNFKVNSEAVEFIFDSVHQDVGRVVLKKALAPGEKITISTPFHIKLPSASISRLGHLGQQYMISQWFPKPAVFDAQGWHAFPYLDQGEFYSEFGNFDVYITLPKNYVVGASGVLQDSSEINWMNEKAKAEIVDSDDFSFPNSDTAKKTLHFVAEKVHDFAWFADKRYHVLKAEIELPESKRKINTWMLFTNSQRAYWKHCSDYVKETVLNYSKWLGEYPYPQITLVDGTIAAGGGMEYPMIAVLGEAITLKDFEYTVVHEVGHNWFYGILGNNERNNPWMDEGLNTYYNLRLMEQLYPKASFVDAYISESYVRFAHLAQYSSKTQYVLAYLSAARKNVDQTITLPATSFTDANYGSSVYSKTGFIFNYLANYLGETLFDSLMHNYFEAWKFRHPQPSNLREIFEKRSSKNLDWFFNDLLSSTKKLDYKISSIHKTDSNYVVKIKNKAAISGPFALSAIKNKEVVKTVWLDGFEGTKQVAFPKGDYSFLEIDKAWNMPEIRRSNNVIRPHGIFKKIEPLQLQFIGSIENTEKTTINYFPVVGYNQYNNFMAGMALYNHALIQKRFEYIVMPMYAFGSNDLNGSIHLNYHWNPNGFLQAIEPHVVFKKYSYRDRPVQLGFVHAAAGIDFNFRKNNVRSPLYQKIKIRNVNIWEDTAPYNYAEKQYKKDRYANNYSINSIFYSLKNKRTLNPFELAVGIEQSNNYAKTMLEALYHFSYEHRRKAAEIRVFGGKFIYNSNANVQYGFTMNGNNDYTYDNIYLGRNDVEGIFNQQFYLKDAGFKNLTLTPNSMDWMLATNIFIPAPGKIPFAFYSDIGKAASSDKLDYDWGVALVIYRNIFEIYAPVQQSSDLNQLNYLEKIRFVLHLNALNPIEQLKNYFN